MIPNGDFEEYYDCDYNVIFTNPIEVLPHWTMRGTAAPKYINMDCLLDPVSTYYGDTTILPAQSGKGFLAHDYVLAYTPTGGRRNYSQVELTQPMEQGKHYFLRYYMTPSFNGSPRLSHHGIYFSDTLIVDTPVIQWLHPPIYLDPHLELDTLLPNMPGEWAKLSYCFTADTNYSVLTLGIFAEPNEILFSYTTNSPDFSREMASYDNFYLAEIDSNLTYEVLEGTDTICAGECLTLSTNHSLIDGVWQWDLPGSDLGSSTDSVVTVCYDTPGVYDVNIWVEHCIGEYENFFPQAITVLENIDHQPAWTDTVVCPGTAVAVDLTSAGYPATWWDGSTAAVRLLAQEGSYAYTLSNGPCEKTYVLSLAFTHQVQYETVSEVDCPGSSFPFLGQVYGVPGIYYDTLYDAQGCDSIIYEINYSHYELVPVEIEAPTGFCEGETALLQITSPHTGIVWGNGETGSSTTVAGAGDHTVVALDANGCEVSAIATVEEWPVPSVSTDDLLDTFFRIGMPLPVSYTGSIEVYGWAPSETLDCGGCPFPLLQRPQEGSYEITVSNAFGCTATGVVRVSFKDSDVYVPNAIRNSPDTWVNGLLFAQSNSDFFYSLKVFDRWGGLRYEADGLPANDPAQGWRPAGQVNPGVYTWMILFEENGRKRVLAGDVTVL